MKRFIINPSTAQARFSQYAFRVDPRNFKGSYMRGGIRL